MKTVITDSRNVLCAIGDFSTFRQDEQDSRIVFLNGFGYAMSGQHIYHDVEVDQDYTPGLYTFDGTSFALYMDERDRIAQEAVDLYTEELLEGGLL